MTDREVMQQALEALEDLGMKHVENTGETLHADVYAALRKALEQPEQGPTCPECKAAVLYECVACSSNNYPPKPDQVDCPRCGHVCSQRPWQGLTDEDVNRESAMIASKMKLAFHAGMYVAQKILKDRNT